jgi:hypothetical protein
MAATQGAGGTKTATRESVRFIDKGSIIRTARAPTVTNGAASVARTLQLPRNAVVVSSFPVTVRVTPGEWFLAADVAQVRTGAPAAGDASFNAIVDFGVARTASGAAMTSSSMDVIDANRWLGANFDTDSLFGARTRFLQDTLSFNAEVRTEQLQVAMSGATNIDQVKNNLAVQLPEPPADLELRLDGAAAIWTSPGVVTAGDLPSDTPATRLTPGKPTNGGTRWQLDQNGDLVQELDLADVITSLLGDPDAQPTDEREITLVLSARVPGAIDLDVPPHPESLLLYRARMTDGFVDARKDSVFTTEGLATIPLKLPSWAASLVSASGTVIATCGPQRTIPPIGPDPELLAAGKSPGGALDVPAAEFVLDSERSIALEMPADHGLATMSAVRIPLRADRSGCEVRAVVLGPDPLDPTAPGSPLDGGAGKPTTIEAKPDGSEQWVTLEFPTAVTLPPATSLFIALLFIRGTATMAAAHVSSDVEGAVGVWRGAPTGPWEQLPDAGGLSGFRGRLRVAGNAPGDRPIAPVRIALGRLPGTVDGLTPSPKGVVFERLADSATTTNELEIVSLTPCTVTVRDVVVNVTR